MPGRILVNDVQLNEHFSLVEVPQGEHADGLVIAVTCKHCVEKIEKEQSGKLPKAWDLDLDPVDNSIDKGSRLALLAHAQSHFTRPKLRRRA